jgi:hypothetical protein
MPNLLQCHTNKVNFNITAALFFILPTAAILFACTRKYRIVLPVSVNTFKCFSEVNGGGMHYRPPTAAETYLKTIQIQAMKKTYTIAFAALFAGMPLTHVQSQLIFNEPFNYPVGNLQGNNGGSGFTTMWDQANTDVAANIGNVTNATIETGSINATYGTGNKARFCLQSGKSTRFDRQFPLNVDVDGTSYWLGFWYSNNSTADNTTYGIAAQFLLMNSPNTTVATDQRLGFGKTSNFTGASGVNSITAFTRASSGGCAAQNWPGTAATATLPAAGTYYILVKISRNEFPNYNIGTLASPVLANLDGIRVWVLTAPPSGSSDPIFTTKPLGDFTTVDINTGNTIPIQTRVLRGGADNTGNTTCKKQGVNGIRIRVEGTSATPFCAEFDELKLGLSLDDVIPVGLLDFGAYQSGKYNELNWATASETNNKGFHIERSSDARSWESIGFVAGVGNSVQTKNYRFTDRTPLELGYYRLRQEDADGRMNLSKIVKLTRNDKTIMSISPNPAQDNIAVVFNKPVKGISLTIADASGRTVLSTTFTGYKSNLDISELASGLYFITMLNGNNKRIARFIKN